MLRTESLNTGKPKNKPELKRLNSEWIQAQQTGENRTNKQRAGWKMAQQQNNNKRKTNKQKTKKSHTEERKEPYDALERREQKGGKKSNQKRKKPQEKWKMGERQ